MHVFNNTFQPMNLITHVSCPPIMLGNIFTELGNSERNSSHYLFNVIQKPER